MKLVERVFLAAMATMTALTIAGCGRKEGDSQAHDPGEAETGVTFNSKKGLLVPPVTARFIGLQVADVEERKITATFQFSAQVYRAAGEAPLASSQPSDT